jgi:hypothetical protein
MGVDFIQALSHRRLTRNSSGLKYPLARVYVRFPEQPIAARELSCRGDQYDLLDILRFREVIYGSKKNGSTADREKWLRDEYAHSATLSRRHNDRVHMHKIVKCRKQKSRESFSRLLSLPTLTVRTFSE